MVSIRCKILVRSELKELGIDPLSIELGEVDIREPLAEEVRARLKASLLKSGLELMDDKKAILVERIKNVIVEMIHYSDELPEIKFSVYLHNKLDYDYTYLSNLFTEVKGITIAQYIIHHKIERVKELIVYDELNLSEIANKLHYSSVSHLSHQFKKMTGLTPSYFKKMRKTRNLTLEDL